MYDTVLLFDKPGGMLTEDKVTIESPSTSTLKPIRQDDTDEVTDLTDYSDTTVIQHLELVPYNTSNNNLQFPTYLFVNTAPEWVEDLPKAIDGLKNYKIKYLPRQWVQKSQDLQYFKMHCSKWKDLIVTRKVGGCTGNLYCPYDDCPFKLSVEGKRTTSNFQNVNGYKICFICGHAANRQWCRA